MHLLAFAESIQLFPDGTLFIHVALILLMIWALNRTLFRPINRVIEAREAHKGGQGGEAGNIMKDVEQKEARYSKEMLDARTRGYELIENEQKIAAEARAKELGAVKSEVTSMFDSGKAELEMQASQARAMISADAEKIADKIAANILKA